MSQDRSLFLFSFSLLSPPFLSPLLSPLLPFYLEGLDGLQDGLHASAHIGMDADVIDVTYTQGRIVRTTSHHRRRRRFLLPSAHVLQHLIQRNQTLHHRLRWKRSECVWYREREREKEREWDRQREREKERKGEWKGERERERREFVRGKGQSDGDRTVQKSRGHP